MKLVSSEVKVTHTRNHIEFSNYNIIDVLQSNKHTYEENSVIHVCNINVLIAHSYFLHGN